MIILVYTMLTILMFLVIALMIAFFIVVIASTLSDIYHANCFTRDCRESRLRTLETFKRIDSEFEKILLQHGPSDTNQ